MFYMQNSYFFLENVNFENNYIYLHNNNIYTIHWKNISTYNGDLFALYVGIFL